MNKLIEQNTLYPIFLKAEQLRFLIIGAGEIGLEKLKTLINNSPQTDIQIVAREVIAKEIFQIIKEHSNIQLTIKTYHIDDLNKKNIVIAAVNDNDLIAQIRKDTIKKNVLLNAADKPQYCDFYLGAVVQKKSLKIAISTNGQSPTLAKRIKETLQEVIPDDTQKLLHSMKQLRESLHVEFKEKVRILNELTQSWTYIKK